MTRKLMCALLALLLAVTLLPLTGIGFAASSSTQTADHEASVTTGGVTTYYDTVEEAFYDAKDKTATITILKDCTVDQSVYLSTYAVVTLDLGEYTVTASDLSDTFIKLNGNSNLTIKGGANGKLLITALRTLIYVDSAASLTLQSGTLASTATGSLHGELIHSYGAVNITGGTISFKNASRPVFWFQPDSSLSVSGTPTITTDTGSTLFYFYPDYYGSFESNYTVSITGGLYPMGFRSEFSDISVPIKKLIPSGYMLADENGDPVTLSDTDHTVTGSLQVIAESGASNKQDQAALTVTGVPAAAVQYGDTFTVTVAGGSGDGAVSWNKSTGVSVAAGANAGEYDVTVTAMTGVKVQATKAASADYKAANSAVHTVTVTPRKLTPEITGDTAKTYDGTTAAPAAAIGLTGAVNGDAPTAAGTCTYNSADVASATTITANNITLTNDCGGKYTLAATTASTAGSITPAAASVEIKNSYAPGKAYDGQPMAVPTAGDLTLSGVAYGDLIMEWTPVSGALTNGQPVNAGTYTLTVSAAAAGNYSAASDSADFTITKTAYTGAVPTFNITVRNTDTRDGYFSLDYMFDSTPLPVGAIIKAVTPPASPVVNATVEKTSDDRVYMDFKSNPMGTDHTDTVKITVESTNYHDFDFNFTLTAVDKYTVTITGTAAATGLVYDGSPKAGYTGTPYCPSFTDADDEYVITYVGTGSTSYGPTADAPANMGSYRVTISIPADHESITGSVSHDFTITGQVYSYTSGAAQSVSTDSNALFVVDAIFDKFLQVKVDGAVVDPANYISESGSTKVTLKAAYLTTLTPGSHTLEVLFTDGIAATTFTVSAAGGSNPGAPGSGSAAPSVPADTGDATGIALWYSLAAIGLLGAAAVLLLGKKHLFSKK